MNSPLGKYSQLVAVAVVLMSIGAYLFAALTGNQAADVLSQYATLAFGAVLGSAATVNGYRRDQVATNKRLDMLGAPPAGQG